MSSFLRGGRGGGIDDRKVHIPKIGAKDSVGLVVLFGGFLGVLRLYVSPLRLKKQRKPYSARHFELYTSIFPIRLRMRVMPENVKPFNIGLYLFQHDGTYFIGREYFH